MLSKGEIEKENVFESFNGERNFFEFYKTIQDSLLRRIYNNFINYYLLMLFAKLIICSCLCITM